MLDQELLNKIDINDFGHFRISQEVSHAEAAQFDIDAQFSVLQNAVNINRHDVKSWLEFIDLQVDFLLLVRNKTKPSTIYTIFVNFGDRKANSLKIFWPTIICIFGKEVSEFRITNFSYYFLFDFCLRGLTTPKTNVAIRMHLSRMKRPTMNVLWKLFVVLQGLTKQALRFKLRSLK